MSVLSILRALKRERAAVAARRAEDEPRLQIVLRPEAAAPPTTETIASIVKRARKYRDNRFVDDVLKLYRETGSMSQKQAAALYRIVAEREEDLSASSVVPLGPVGSIVLVEGEVLWVEYSGKGKGKARRARYGIACGASRVVFSGLAVLAGERAIVRFKARVAQHDEGLTIVCEPTDIQIVKRPSENPHSQSVAPQG